MEKHIKPLSSQAKRHRAMTHAALALVSAAALLSCSARLIPGFASWYSAHIYSVLQFAYGHLTGPLPFSVSEVLVSLLPVLLVSDIFMCRKHPAYVLRHLALFAAILLFMYSANCGVNYYRDGFVTHEVYASEYTADQLGDFCEYITERLSEGADEFAYPDDREIASSAVISMKKLGEDYPSLHGYYPEPKMLKFLSGFFSSMEVSGIYSPFTIEANVNGDMPGMEKPFTSCHELSHLRGYMNEGEANYIGWLACIGSDDPAFRRSGWLIAWNYAGSALRRADPERFRVLCAGLPDYAIRELAENHEFWSSHRTAASDVQDSLNDAYLKSNGQAGGISTYGQLTILMLHWYTAKNNL